jgi:hypothetical protein
MQDHLESRPHRNKMDLVKARRRGNEGFRPTGRRRCQGRDGVSGRMVWGQGVVVTLLSRKINDNCVENQAKLIIYVHQTLLKMYYTKRLIIPYWNISLSQVYFPQRRT